MDHSVTDDRLLEGFDLSDGVAVPTGNYRFTRTELRFGLGSHRPVSGFLGYEFGGFFGSSRRELSYSGRAELNERFSLEPDRDCRGKRRRHRRPP